MANDGIERLEAAFRETLGRNVDANNRATTDAARRADEIGRFRRARGREAPTAKKAPTPTRTPPRRRASANGSPRAPGTARASGYPVMTPAELAEMLGLTVDTLRKWRIQGRGPAFIRETRRSCIYRKSDVDEWLARSVQKMQITERRKRKAPASKENNDLIS